MNEECIRREARRAPPAAHMPDVLCMVDDKIMQTIRHRLHQEAMTTHDRAEALDEFELRCLEHKYGLMMAGVGSPKSLW